MEKKLLHIGVLLVVDWILEGLAVKKKKKLIGQKNAWMACLVATVRTMRNLQEERKKKKEEEKNYKKRTELGGVLHKGNVKINKR